MTMAIPDKTFDVMKRHPEIRWTEVARPEIESKAKLDEGEQDPW